MIVLSESAGNAIRSHGKEAYHDEACGAMFGHVRGATRKVLRVTSLDNGRADERHRRFVVTPDDYRRAEAEADASGMTLIGFYHSHPDHPAYPSEYDLRHAFPFFSYVIVAVAHAEPGPLRSFVLADDRETFLEETVREE